MSEETGTKLEINVKGPSELKLQVAVTSDKTVLELKQAIADMSGVSADRQRLIYSGSVLKDGDALSVCKIQSSHTIHMVEGVSNTAPSFAHSSAQPLLPMSAGSNEVLQIDNITDVVADLLIRIALLSRDIEELATTRQALIGRLAVYEDALARAQGEPTRSWYLLYLTFHATAWIIFIVTILATRG